MRRTRTTEEPGAWQIVHLQDDESPMSASVTLSAYGRTVRLSADGKIHLEGLDTEILAVREPRRRRDFTGVQEQIEKIGLEVEAVTKVKLSTMRSPVRSRVTAVNQARHVVAFLAAKRLRATRKEIGEYLNMDHSSVTHAIWKIQDQLDGLAKGLSSHPQQPLGTDPPGPLRAVE